ncbi:unnamed protein product [Linum trigynum]|uniref:Uncharacterized protein n=1 Tax=Linum trigynum TaxID=586398 RepID=A0AAV2FY04_9ROSI
MLLIHLQKASTGIKLVVAEGVEISDLGVFGRISTTATSTHVVLRIAPAVVARFLGHAAPTDFLSPVLPFPRLPCTLGSDLYGRV